MKLNLKKDWWTVNFIWLIMSLLIGVVQLAPKLSVSPATTVALVFLFIFSGIFAIGIYKRSKLVFWILFVMNVWYVIKTNVAFFQNNLPIESINIFSTIRYVIGDIFLFMLFLQVMKEGKLQKSMPNSEKKV